jgi:hypothetical protein
MGATGITDILFFILLCIIFNGTGAIEATVNGLIIVLWTVGAKEGKHYRCCTRFFTYMVLDQLLPSMQQQSFEWAVQYSDSL